MTPFDPKSDLNNLAMLRASCRQPKFRDGREAVQFLVTVKQCLEDPARMVLEI